MQFSTHEGATTSGWATVEAEDGCQYEMRAVTSADGQHTRFETR